MTRIELGKVADGYEGYVKVYGFDVTYEIVETDGGATNSFDNAEEFAEEVVMLNNPMGFYIMKSKLTKAVKELIDIDDESYAMRVLDLTEEQLEWLL